MTKKEQKQVQPSSQEGFGYDDPVSLEKNYYEYEQEESSKVKSLPTYDFQWINKWGNKALNWQTNVEKEVKKILRKSEKEAVVRAVHADDPALIKPLIQKGADIDGQDEKGATALHIAIRRGYYQVARAILEEDVDVNKKDHRGRTPLHIAAYVNSISLAKLLLTKDATVNVPDDTQTTPLMLAVQKEAWGMAELLLYNGAIVNVADIHGLTVMDYAKQLDVPPRAAELLLAAAQGRVEKRKVKEEVPKLKETDEHPVIESKEGTSEGAMAVCPKSDPVESRLSLLTIQSCMTLNIDDADTHFHIFSHETKKKLRRLWFDIDILREKTNTSPLALSSDLEEAKARIDAEIDFTIEEIEKIWADTADN